MQSATELPKPCSAVAVCSCGRSRRHRQLKEPLTSRQKSRTAVLSLPSCVDFLRANVVASNHCPPKSIAIGAALGRNDRYSNTYAAQRRPRRRADADANANGAVQVIAGYLDYSDDTVRHTAFRGFRSFAARIRQMRPENLCTSQLLISVKF